MINLINKLAREYLPNSLRDKLYNYLHDKFVINYFQTSHPKHALLSYITVPFTSKSRGLSHNNELEAKYIAELLNTQNYNVDVINFNSSKSINYDKYDLIIGFGDPLVASFHNRTKQILTIYYATGCSVIFQNPQTLKRVEECYHKTGHWFLDSSRVVEKTWSEQTSLPDAIISLGSELIGQTYQPITDKPVHSIYALYHKAFDYKAIIAEKDFASASKHFLWFGSTGFIHKGLDLLLEVFSARPDLHLHVCGPLYKDPKFTNYFHQQLFETPNIHCHGFVDISSDEFRQILLQCGFTILPSCSEASATSVLNVIGNSGIIPLVTPYCGIKPMECAFEIEDLSRHGIDRTIDKALALSPEQLKQNSLTCGSCSEKWYSPQAYQASLAKAFNNVLESCRETYNL